MAATGSVVTIKEIAAAAGVSIAAVSYALRSDPKIPIETRQRIQEIARRIGYRPNPRVASLMAHIRRAHARPPGERIAFVWVHTTREDAAHDSFLQWVFRGARQRAEQMGFGLEQYWTPDRGISERRLEHILRARGIVGVVLSPVTTDEPSVALDWDWSRFSAAVIGNVTWIPELHHAGHHHYLGMRLALIELGKLGCQRPAAIIERNINERAKRAWEAAFLTHHPRPRHARSFVRMAQADSPREMARWLSALHADALIISAPGLMDSPEMRAACRDLGSRCVTLHWSGEFPAVAGVDQCYDRIAAHAVDLVLAQLNSNETGVPDLPRMMLFPGRWVEAR